jgi:hypothetical protein
LTRDGLTVKAGTVKWVNFMLAALAVIGPSAGWYLSQASSRAAVEAVVGTRLARAESDINELRQDITSMRIENNALRAEIARVGADVAWIRGRMESGARVGSGQ